MLARDRLGIKPLYYYHDDDYFVFGSEIKAILELPFIKKEICDEALYHYLTLGVSPAPDTLFTNIKKLEPGHYISIKTDIDEYIIQRVFDYQTEFLATKGLIDYFP